MKLLSIEKDKFNLIIVTDEGRRKISLKWSNLQEIEKKCQNLIDKNIKISTYTRNGHSSEEWFNDIWEDVDNKIANENIEIRLPKGLVFENYLSEKIFGPPGTGKTTQYRFYFFFK